MIEGEQMMLDKETTVYELRQDVREFIKSRDWDQFHSPKDLAIGLIIEAGEFLEHFRFRSDLEIEAYLEKPDFCNDIQNELADCFYFILAIANNLDVDLSEAFHRKMTLSAERYPVDKVKGRNDKYTVYQD